MPILFLLFGILVALGKYNQTTIRYTWPSKRVRTKRLLLSTLLESRGRDLLAKETQDIYQTLAKERNVRRPNVFALAPGGRAHGRQHGERPVVAAAAVPGARKNLAGPRAHGGGDGGAETTMTGACWIFLLVLVAGDGGQSQANNPVQHNTAVKQTRAAAEPTFQQAMLPRGIPGKKAKGPGTSITWTTTLSS